MAEPTPEQATQILKEAQQPQPIIKATPAFRVETKTGAVFEGQTEQEVLQKLVESVENGSQRIKELGTEVGTLRQQVQQQPPQRLTGPEHKSVQDQYWEIWQKDPIAADRFAESVRLGVPIEQVDQVQRGTMQAAAISQQQTAATEFMNRCPDYPAGDAAASAAITKRMQERFPGQVPTADHLELIYNDLVRSGTVTPRDVPIEEVRNPATPLPRLGSSIQPEPVDFMRQFRDLKPDQMKKVIEELKAKGAR